MDTAASPKPQGLNEAYEGDSKYKCYLPSAYQHPLGEHTSQNQLTKLPSLHALLHITWIFLSKILRYIVQNYRP